MLARLIFLWTSRINGTFSLSKIPNVLFKIPRAFTLYWQNSYRVILTFPTTTILQIWRPIKRDQTWILQGAANRIHNLLKVLKSHGLAIKPSLALTTFYCSTFSLFSCENSKYTILSVLLKHIMSISYYYYCILLLLIQSILIHGWRMTWQRQMSPLYQFQDLKLFIWDM